MQAKWYQLQIIDENDKLELIYTNSIYLVNDKFTCFIHI